ncbi:MAG: hypothetical protein ABW321_18870 [Polyangiales bacterium]
MEKTAFASLRGALMLAAAALALWGCESDPDATAPAGEERDRWYVLATIISDDEGANSYIKVMDDITHGEITLDDARELVGIADLKANDGKLLVSDGESPKVSRFTVERDGSLGDDGEIGFGNYTDNAGIARHVLVREDKAYLLDEAGGYVIWNPRTLAIDGTIPFPELAPRDGIDAAPGLDIGMVVRGDFLFHTIAWADYENFAMTDRSAILITNVEKDEVVGLLEVDCPDLNVASSDGEGNLYFSNWVYSPAATLAHGAAKACAVKIPAGEMTIDEDWTVTFADVTGGHEAAALRVLANGDAIISVFDETHAPFDPETDDVAPWVFGANWKAYRFDLDTKTATELEGIDWNSGGYYLARLDDTDYLLNPGDGYASTQIYALDDDGPAQPILQTPGWATRFVVME